MIWARLEPSPLFDPGPGHMRHSQPMFLVKHLRGNDGEKELAAKAYNDTGHFHASLFILYMFGFLVSSFCYFGGTYMYTYVRHVWYAAGLQMSQSSMRRSLRMLAMTSHDCLRNACSLDFHIILDISGHIRVSTCTLYIPCYGCVTAPPQVLPL